MAMKPLCRPISDDADAGAKRTCLDNAAAPNRSRRRSTACRAALVDAQDVVVDGLFGMPTTETASTRAAHSSEMASAPAWPLPFPPITNTMSMPCFSIESNNLGHVAAAAPGAARTAAAVLLHAPTSLSWSTPGSKPTAVQNVDPNRIADSRRVCVCVCVQRRATRARAPRDPLHSVRVCVMAACVRSGSW